MVRVSWTIGDLLKVTTQYLKEKGIESPRLTSEVLLARLLQVDRVTLYLQFEKPLTEKELSLYRERIRRRVGREPLQYITGFQEFWSMEFAVDARALIPRPETELLMEQALAAAKGIPPGGGSKGSILDLGTGSGILAVCLACELPGWIVWATDISEDALELARLNAARHGVSDRIRFRKGDLFEPFTMEGIGFDIIVCNPPYVAEEDYARLPPEVRDHEPRMALAGGSGGTECLDRVLREAERFLNPGGWLLLEMAPEQTERMLTLAGELGCYRDQRRIRDYTGRYRMVMTRKRP